MHGFWRIWHEYSLAFPLGWIAARATEGSFGLALMDIAGTVCIVGLLIFVDRNRHGRKS